MTIKQWQEMMLTETGETYTVKQAKVMMSIEAEHESEAIAGGKYDVAPIDEPKRYHSESCFVAMQRGSECLCGLIPWDESYHGGEMTVSEAQSELASIAREWFPTAFDAEHRSIPTK